MERIGGSGGRGVVGRRATRLAVWLLIALPVAFGFLYVRLFGVNVVYGDEWRLVNLFRKLHAGTLAFPALWAQLNEHRIVVPRLVILTIGTATRFDTVAEMYATQALLLAELAVLFFAFRARFAQGPLWPLIFAPVAFLVFGLRQAEIMLMGLLVQFALVSAFAVLAFFCLDRTQGESRGDPRKGFGAVLLPFAGALASAVVASLSAAQGLLVWPAGLLQILLGPGAGKRKAASAAVWALAGACTWAAYFRGWHPPRSTAALAAGRPA